LWIFRVVETSARGAIVVLIIGRGSEREGKGRKEVEVWIQTKKTLLPKPLKWLSHYMQIRKGATYA